MVDSWGVAVWGSGVSLEVSWHELEELEDEDVERNEAGTEGKRCSDTGLLNERGASVHKGKREWKGGRRVGNKRQGKSVDTREEGRREGGKGGGVEEGV